MDTATDGALGAGRAAKEIGASLLLPRLLPMNICITFCPAPCTGVAVGIKKQAYARACALAGRSLPRWLLRASWQGLSLPVCSPLVQCSA